MELTSWEKNLEHHRFDGPGETAGWGDEPVAIRRKRARLGGVADQIILIVGVVITGRVVPTESKAGMSRTQAAWATKLLMQAKRTPKTVLRCLLANALQDFSTCIGLDSVPKDRDGLGSKSHGKTGMRTGYGDGDGDDRMARILQDGISACRADACPPLRNRNRPHGGPTIVNRHQGFPAPGALGSRLMSGAFFSLVRGDPWPLRWFAQRWAAGKP